MGEFRPRSFGGNDRNSRGGSRGGDRSGGRSFGGGNRGGYGGGRDSRGGRSFGGDRRGGFGGRKPEMHDVVCAKCGKDTQVPFKPTGDKPVYCRDCFGGNDNNSRGNSSVSGGISKEQFDKLNKKLDKILGILANTDEEAEDEETVGDKK
jgi:CxxC-x17-CxxC domain-containing protein